MKKKIIKITKYIFALIISFFVVYQCSTFIMSPTPQTINLTSERINSSDFDKLGINSEALDFLFDYDVEYKKTMYHNGKYLGFQAKINEINITSEQIEEIKNVMKQNNKGSIIDSKECCFRMGFYKNKESYILDVDSKQDTKTLYIFLKIDDFND